MKANGIRRKVSPQLDVCKMDTIKVGVGAACVAALVLKKGNHELPYT